MRKFIIRGFLLGIGPLFVLFSVVSAQEVEESNIARLSSDGPLEMSELRVNADEIGLYEKFEITFNVRGEWENPFDPDQIQADARFYAPDGGELIVPGFFYQEYRREDGGLEKVREPVWKVRFTPVKSGEYRYQVVVNNKGKEISSPSGAFTSVPYNANHGFLRISETNPLYFEFDDGTPFFGVAMGRQQGNIYNRRSYNRFANVGGNFNRLFLTNGALNLGEMNPRSPRPDRGLGKMNLEGAWNLDRVLEAGEKPGIYHILSLTNQWTFNNRWEVHAYNKENGGVLEAPAEYWTNEEAMRYFERHLRYLVARWGYSTSVFSWDLWNEYTAMRGGSDMTRAIPWHQRMARYISSIDVFDHVIHTNDGSLNGRDQMHALPEIELVSTNIYAVKNLANIAETWTKRMISQFEKPYVLTEFGPGHGIGNYGEMDPERRMVHNGLWSPLMSGGAATGLAWEGSWLDHEIFYTYTEAVSKFVDGIPFSKRQWQPVDVTSFTFTGYQTHQVPVNGGTPIDNTLQPGEEEELVEVGYGTQKRKTITGSISVVDVNELRKAPVANLSEALAGMVPTQASGNRKPEPSNPAYGDVIVEGWSGNFSIPNDKASEQEFFQIDKNGRVDPQEFLSAVLVGPEEQDRSWLVAPNGLTSSVTFRVEYPVDGEFVVYVTELRKAEPVPQLAVTLDGKQVIQKNLLPLEVENYRPRRYNQYYTIDVSRGSHTIRIENSGGGSFVTAFELNNYTQREGPDLEVRGLQSEDHILLWLKNQKFTILHSLTDVELQSQPEGLLELQNVPNGRWIAEWMNTIDATWLKTEVVESKNHKLVLETPVVEKSIAVRLRRL